VLRDARDKFILIACDGVWDVFSNEEAAKFVLNLMELGARDMSQVASALIDAALAKGSTDNLSAFVIRLPGAPSPAPYVCLLSSSRITFGSFMFLLLLS
jgi:serine/threonine protein phosphatase PrpC